MSKVEEFALLDQGYTVHVVRTLVRCEATTYVVTDKSKLLTMGTSFCSSGYIIELADGNRSAGLVQGNGNAKISISGADGVIHDVCVENALYIP